jgi:hypothetical protein
METPVGSTGTGPGYSTTGTPIMKFFSYGHLPVQLQEVSKKFFDLASWIDETLPNNAEKSTALRKVLEAKDCAVRSTMP